MTTRYTEKQIEDVARIIREHHAGLLETYSRPNHECMAADFAGLFAADNPSGCGPDIHDGPCFSAFGRKQFLEACGLESEG
jgi:hypothetical protein